MKCAVTSYILTEAAKKPLLRQVSENYDDGPLLKCAVP